MVYLTSSGPQAKQNERARNDQTIWKKFLRETYNKYEH